MPDETEEVGLTRLKLVKLADDVKFTDSDGKIYDGTIVIGSYRVIETQHQIPAFSGQTKTVKISKTAFDISVAFNPGRIIPGSFPEHKIETSVVCGVIHRNDALSCGVNRYYETASEYSARIEAEKNVTPDVESSTDLSASE